MSKKSCFLEALLLTTGSVVSIVGAGGKTSLLFQLAKEAKASGLRVLVTTTTRMRIPHDRQYDRIALEGPFWDRSLVNEPGIYVAGIPDTQSGKMRGVATAVLEKGAELFDLVLIEADGAAGKPLKGWKAHEPVVPFYSTHTVGVLDIQTIGRIIDDKLVHRLDIFRELTGAELGDIVDHRHLKAVVQCENGLFRCSVGKKILYINKVESEKDRSNVLLLKAHLWGLRVVFGSLHNERVNSI